MCYQKIQFACGHDGSIVNGDRIFVRKGNGTDYLVESPSLNGAPETRSVPSRRFAKEICVFPETCSVKKEIQVNRLRVPCSDCYTKQSKQEEHDAYKKFAESCEAVEPSARRLEFSHPERKPELKLSDMKKATVGLLKRSGTKARNWRDQIKNRPMKGYTRSGGQEPMMMLPLKKGQPARQDQGSAKP